jgi:hypothetical protein
MWTELSLGLKSGDPILWAMAFFLALSLLVIMERFVTLYFYYNINFSQFSTEIKKMVLSQDYEKAIAFSRSVSKTSGAKIALEALEAYDLDPLSVKGRIDESVLEFLPRVEQRMYALPVFASIMVLLGICGSLYHIWNTFHATQVLESAYTQSTFNHGIAQSLNLSLVGAISAVLILAGHGLLRGVALRITNGILLLTTVLTNLLVPKTAGIVSQSTMAAPTMVKADKEFSSAAGETNTSSPIDSQSTANNTSPATNQSATLEDALNDSSPVEDIKDEEEII